MISLWYSYIFLSFSCNKFINCLCRLPYVNQEAQQYKILYIGLYLLIWGEAANLRFMPECLCYIFHHVSWKICLCWLFPCDWLQVGSRIGWWNTACFFHVTSNLVGPSCMSGVSFLNLARINNTNQWHRETSLCNT